MSVEYYHRAPEKSKTCNVVCATPLDYDREGVESSYIYHESWSSLPLQIYEIAIIYNHIIINMLIEGTGFMIEGFEWMTSTIAWQL